MADATTARTGIDPTVVRGTRGGSPITLDTITRKLGQPGGGVPITPANPGGPPSGTPANPPPTKGGTPIDRPWDPGNPVPPGPTTPPTNPKPPATDPAQRPPTNPDPPKGGSPGPSPTPLPDDSNFSKGQVRNEQLPGDIYAPFFEAFYGNNGFNPYRGSNQNVPSGGTARTYDPLGIGADAYTNPDASYYGLEGVNSVLQPKGGARWGVVGGNGGYGFGMVGPDYTGPQFDDPRDVVKAMRRQRRALNGVTKATYTGPTGGSGAGGAGTTTGSTGTTTGGNVNNKGGQPAATGAPAATTQQQGGKGGQPPAAPGSPAANGDVLKSLEMYLPTTFNSPNGRLVQSSVGNGNIYTREGGNGNDLYHYDPNVGWKHMTADEYRGYNNPSDFYKDPTQYAAQAGGVKQQWERKNGLIQGKVGTGVYA